MTGRRGLQVAPSGWGVEREGLAARIVITCSGTNSQVVSHHILNLDSLERCDPTQNKYSTKQSYDILKVVRYLEFNMASVLRQKCLIRHGNF